MSVMPVRNSHCVVRLLSWTHLPHTVSLCTSTGPGARFVERNTAHARMHARACFACVALRMRGGLPKRV